jgi:hypothetical protein
VGVLCWFAADRTIAGAARRRSGRTAAGGETAGPAGGTKGVGAAIRSAVALAQSGDADELAVGAASQIVAARLAEQIEAVVVVDLGAAEAGLQTAAADKVFFDARCLTTTGPVPEVWLAAVGKGSRFAGCLAGLGHFAHAAERFGGEDLARFGG